MVMGTFWARLLVDMLRSQAAELSHSILEGTGVRPRPATSCLSGW